MYPCQRADCDFFERYPNALLNRFAIARRPAPTRVLYWPAVQRYMGNVGQQQATLLADSYFEAVASALWPGFGETFDRAQMMVTATGGPDIDLSDIVLWTGSSHITIFMNIGEKRLGYFCPMGQGPFINLAQVDHAFPIALGYLQDQFGFSEFDDHPLDGSLLTFARMMVRAHRHERAQRAEQPDFNPQCVSSQSSSPLQAMSLTLLIATMSRPMSGLTQKRPHFLDTVGRIAAMVYHRVTVRAHWAKVNDRINFVPFADFRKLA
jgi:hypothetical protein